MTLMKHNCPGRVDFRDGGKVDIGNKNIQEGAKMLDPREASIEVMVS